MLLALFYLLSTFSVVRSVPPVPISYVRRSDGFSRTILSGRNNEYRKIIVKRFDMPSTVTSYSTFITHPVSSNHDNPNDQFVAGDNYWDKGPVEYFLNDDLNDDEEYENNNTEYWSNFDEDEDVEEYISKLFPEGLVESIYSPHNEWFGKAYRR